MQLAWAVQFRALGQVVRVPKIARCWPIYVLFPAGFLENINNMLTSGMVPALYPDDEKEAIIGSVRSK